MYYFCLMKKVMLFASGGGSNVRAILRYFKDRSDIAFPAIICNNNRAGVINIAAEEQIELILIDRDIFQSPVFLDTIDYFCPDLLVLAGFLWKIPEYLVKAYPNKIVNIHPALLPKYGGRGMYGHHVHEAVIAAGESQSGMTIHFVNEQYDEGTILLQKSVAVRDDETANSLAASVLTLEHEWYPKVIDTLLQNS